MLNNRKVERLIEILQEGGIVFLFVYLLFLISCGLESGSVSINSIEEAQKHALGIWTHTEVGFVFWTKYVVQDNGSYIMYIAEPTADDWGKPYETGTWRITTGKYANTGQRYYAIEFKSSEKSSLFGDFPTYVAPFINSKKLSSDVYNYLEKGDKFPFSK